ncbi:MAG: N-formylglutamate amidohydrolase [Myxococcota bacterium]
MAASAVDFDVRVEPAFELRHVDANADASLPPELRNSVAVSTVHDGQAIPAEFRFRSDGTPVVPPRELARQFVQMRDWGANVVAAELASALGLPHYARCRLARVLLDFNRFPGSTPAANQEPLEALAIGPIYADALLHQQKTAILDRYFDSISAGLEQQVADKLICITIHTYDPRHPSRTQRADVSLISLPLSYQRESRLTYGVFDPIFPDRLVESTCSRVLRDRISLNLERSNYRVIHNHPYPLPDGSIELRSQIWFFFRYVRLRFVAERPETADDPAYERVWTMLLDTNLRLAEADALRGYLHRFRRVPGTSRAALEASVDAYHAICDYVRESRVVDAYRYSPDRPSSLGVEVRKDLVCTFDSETGWPKRPTEAQRETVRDIARAMAGAIATYFDTDREVLIQKVLASGEAQAPY